MNRRVATALFGCLLMSSVLAAGNALAHDRRVTTGEVQVSGQHIHIRYRLRRMDVTSIGPEAATWAHHLRGPAPERVAATLLPLYTAEGCAFEPGSFARVDGGDASEVRFAWSLRCDPLPASLRVRPFPAPGHLHVVTIVTGDGESARMLVGERARDVPLVNSAPPSAMSALDYLGHGFEHAIVGWDHILFVILLVLLAPRWRSAALVVTGFTLGHSLTLALAALGWLDVDGRSVEVLIAASIVGMAAENVGRVGGSRHASYVVAALAALVGIALSVPALIPVGVMIALASHISDDGGSTEVDSPNTTAALPARFALAGCFGMVHGLGFSTGLDAEGEGVLLRLFAFNVGVEAAQLVTVVGFLLALRLTRVRHHGPHHARVVVATSTAIAAIGAFTTIARAVG